VPFARYRGKEDRTPQEVFGRFAVLTRPNFLERHILEHFWLSRGEQRREEQEKFWFDVRTLKIKIRLPICPAFKWVGDTFSSYCISKDLNQ
jgi:hypothetical protein